MSQKPKVDFDARPTFDLITQPQKDVEYKVGLHQVQFEGHFTHEPRAVTMRL
jgi:hypothetical protein